MLAGNSGGRRRDSLPGLDLFASRHPTARRLLVGSDGIDLEDFLLAEPDLNVYDIEVDPETMTVAWSKTLGLADSFALSVYDAAYLELALRRGLPLASLDDSLRRAIQKAGGQRLP